MIHYPLASEVVYFDIGQGDSTLIKTRFSKEVILIDTGGKVNFNSQRWQKAKELTKGETIIANYLLSKGITKIDQLYLTHQDTDHVGNFPDLSQKIKIKQIIVPKGMEELASFKRRLAKSTVKRQDVYGVTDKMITNSNNLQLLHPFEKGQGTNEDSLVLWLRLAGKKYIFTGDLGQQGEEAVLKKYPYVTTDVLKTGHHGSKTATGPDFVKKIDPKVAIISAGRNNRYGHPNKETLETLKRYNIPYFLTARDGMIKFINRFGKTTIECYLKNN